MLLQLVLAVLGAENFGQVGLKTRCALSFRSGSGGGASGRAPAFCLLGPGSSPGTNLAFSVQNCCLSILTKH